MVNYIDLPAVAVREAFRAPNGEYAWRRPDLSSAMQELVERRLAILSGEVWLVEGSLFSTLSPHREGGWAVFAWQAGELQPGESWQHFAQRTMDETLQRIYELDPEACVQAEAAGKLFYHLCFSDESSYRVGTPGREYAGAHSVA